MAKGEHIELEGVITKSLKGKDFSVQIKDMPSEVIGTLKGNLIKNKIKVVPGDVVQVLVSVYDLSRGFISRRITGNNRHIQMGEE